MWYKIAAVENLYEALHLFVTKLPQLVKFLILDHLNATVVSFLIEHSFQNLNQVSVILHEIAILSRLRNFYIIIYDETINTKFSIPQKLQIAICVERYSSCFIPPMLEQKKLTELLFQSFFNTCNAHIPKFNRYNYSIPFIYNLHNIQNFHKNFR